MRITALAFVCVFVALGCGGDGGGTAGDSGGPDVMDIGQPDTGPMDDVMDSGDVRDPGDEDPGPPPVDVQPEPGWPDGFDAVDEEVQTGCMKPEDCDDGNDCTQDLCADFQCKHECLQGLECDDGNPFSFPDKCLLEPLTGQCLCHGHLECERDKDCNDLDPCTTDSCDPNGICQHDCQAGIPCNDADPGTIGDLCESDPSGQCGCVGTEADCQVNDDCDDGNPCTQDTCTPDNQCTYGCFEGQTCDDGHPFTSMDKCIYFAFLGKCFCQGELECLKDKDCDDADPCTKDWCNDNGQCHHDCDLGSACDDQDPGTIDDVCLSSLIEECVCMGTPAECTGDDECDDGNGCTLDVCTEMQCLHGCLEGLKCDDGNPFSSGDKCLVDPVNDQCLCLGKPDCIVDKDCDDGSDCTLDWCDDNGACHHDCDSGALCSDGDPGTIKDTCLFSPLGLCECMGTPAGCTDDKDCDDGNDCTLDGCKDGKCWHDCLDGLKCDDGIPFTTDDKCLFDAFTGKCFCHGEPDCLTDKDCDDTDDCTKDWCDAKGQCHHDCLEGEKCNDGNPKTIKDQCEFADTGACWCLGIEVECQDDADCDDGNDCTLDGCNDGDCWHDCLDGLMCDDGDPFTDKDKCLNDPLTANCWCQGETECQEHADCDDGNDCTKDACDKNGVCHNDCLPDEKCNDGNPDTIKDTCLFSLLGECVCEGIEVECQEDADCDDGNDCTLDGCKDGNCWHDCQEGLPCDDMNPFTAKDECLFDPVTMACTCLGKPECIGDGDCDDGDGCTDDWCDKNGQCHHDCLAGEKCDDGKPDTIKDQCEFSPTGACWCLGIEVECQDDADCDDGNECTLDGCLDGDCWHDCLDGLKCDDGDIYTFKDRCLSDPLSMACFCEGVPECTDDDGCDDGNECTKDWCDDNGVCHHDCQLDQACNDGDPLTVMDFCGFTGDGTCVCEGIPVDCVHDKDCDDGNQCTLDVCYDGKCYHDCTDGLDCDDGNPFTDKDVCWDVPILGECLCEGQYECLTDEDCDDGNQCTDDVCNKNGQCHNLCKVEEKCDDGDPGTILDQCLFSLTGGCICFGQDQGCKEDSDCDDGNQCTLDVCNDGQCIYDCLDGSQCDDGNPFTQKDVCFGNPFTGDCLCEGQYECTGDDDCADDNDCTLDWCDKNGQCHNDCQPEEKCDDGDPMTIQDTCLFSPTGACTCEGQSIQCQDNADCDPTGAATQFCQFDAGICDPPGLCVPYPLACPLIWDPVCGCDGTTYSNECMASMAGVSVDYPGECVSPYCWSNAMCGDDEYCFFEVCDLESGMCQERPLICPNIWLPVCGCDGNTYGNECEAAKAGMSVDYQGECEQTICWSNDMCTQEEYCLLDVCDSKSGVCTERPLVCPYIWDPVCGCDGNTYANECLAAQAGVSVDYQGECVNPYCWSNDMCAEDEYCFFEVCELESGVCEKSPLACLEIWDPVCGCDGQTYANACLAAMAGVSVDYQGECKANACWSNDMCAKEEYCFFEVCAQETGECKERPVVCLDIWDPVCGCDGKTYGNACEAAAAGMSVDYTGACK